jgi:hypothetical protein
MNGKPQLKEKPHNDQEKKQQRYHAHLPIHQLARRA